MNHVTAKSNVRIWEETRDIPTYGTGKPDKNPMFLEKRIYQGSSGKVYPHPVIDSIEDEAKMKSYRLVILENEYVRIEMMPELGGRIYRALDRTNNYDFVYYNRVIKPALVGLAGPWISGGIEFNWPQHHRPNTFGPVDYTFGSNQDGSATVWVGEIDRMYGTKMTAGFTLHPGKAYLEIHAEVYNRTSAPQTFLWWANPAVAVNDHTQSVFPPDVTAVLDHGKRDVSRFPIATGTYYKMDYSEGVDISRYKNIPVPTSYMAYKSDYNFVGGYDHGVQAGLLHVANHHISPGKKQWTWGNGEFGQAWDRQLTDEDGPYIELMTGIYTDNQPDFTWLQPYEAKSFSQYFMPYKGIGMVKNATIDAAVNLEMDETTGMVTVMVYATSVFEQVTVEVIGPTMVYLHERCNISPTELYKSSFPWSGQDEWHQVKLSVRTVEGKELVAYQPERTEIQEVPDPATPLPLPSEIRTNEQLYLAGLHLEQYRHATYEPEPYYLEGLKRDATDIRLNIAYGTLLLRRGLFQDAEKHFRQAVQSLTWKNTNPYDSEAFYQLGLSLKLQGKQEEAYAALYKAVWSAQYQDTGYYMLAQIDTGQHRYIEALDHIERSLIRNTRNYKARHLKVALLRRLGQNKQAIQYARETLELDPVEFGAAHELVLIYSGATAPSEREQAGQTREHFHRLMRGDVYNYLNLAADYADCGLWEEALTVLSYVESEIAQPYPMVGYVQAYLYHQLGDVEQARECKKQGKAAPTDYCFPNTSFEFMVLQDALAVDSNDARAHYYLGNWLYDHKRYEEAITHWETSREVDAAYSTVHRNLGLAYYNKLNRPDLALASLEEAFRLDSQDARIFYELDQLHKKIGYSCENRVKLLEQHMELVHLRDDLYIEWVTLLNMQGSHQEAWNALQTRRFHPWEGGEGKVTGQYVTALTELAKRKLEKQQPELAMELLKKALVYPENLGEGKLEGAGDNPVYFYLGCAYQQLKSNQSAEESFHKASIGLNEPASAMFYNDQPPESIYYQGLAWQKLGNVKEANRRFNKLIDYAERHMHDHIRMDYFAVSLPDFLVFDDDFNQRNEEHCRYMRALGLLGLGRTSEAKLELERILEKNPNHQGAIIHR
ncbi:DUF5107 domain-containing protein [Paenibacillus sp. BGI2013]|uniref:DUF5107 domain-containing protein n=1 Tax=Paenibacillus TaxID=44249 RepID=UPI00096D12EF|nr:MULTISPECIES: DUF5107 domain-containing protein [Paenibacillus]OMF47510.1 DUF5107 domain-containing protein [Paenibacillus amylolyticus]PKQ90423.1 DUF5107 domain-containing protein [Paenibacillus sp. BGI2013]